MSTLSGNATKGEKGKKFQQLKINLCTANKPTEPEQQQHKSNIQRKQHGMTSLGKVPTARRPTILPSEKSEHSGNDPSVNLVPGGGAGWGNKQNESGSTTPSLVQSTNSPPNVSVVTNVSMPGTLQQVPHVQHYPPTSRMPPLPQVGHITVHHGHTDVKTWAMMTHGNDSSAPNFLTPQSPLFQHEFPSLSSNAEASSAPTPTTATATQKPTASTTADMQYGPGPSLRPQTEGSWIQGGSRPQGTVGAATGNPSATAPVPVRPMGPYPPHIGPDGVRNNLAPSGVAVVPGGPYPAVMPQQHMIPPQYGGMMPPFMLRSSYPGSFPPNFQGSIKGVGPRPPYNPYMSSGPHGQAERFMGPPGTGANSPSKRPYDEEDVKIRPIIKEEDLHQMATIGNDIGWAGHEDIDYNQKLKFSDDEDDEKNKENRGKAKTKSQPLLKNAEKPVERKEIEKENDLRNCKESLKEREKLYSTDTRNPEVRNAWQLRRTVLPTPTPTTARYQIPANGRFEEDEEAWKEKLRQKKEEIEIIVQRAKERKEEEEKRFIEQQQAAALKLKKLEAEMFANQCGNKENKVPYPGDRDVDMLPEWEKEKLKTQNRLNDETQSTDDGRKTQNAIPIPVVKDGSEFRALTQLVDRSNVLKKEGKERENVQSGYSRTFTNNIPPRFQNLNRQNSCGFSSSSSTVGPTRSNLSQHSQFSGKSNNPSFGNARHHTDVDSSTDKDRDWNHEENKERENDRYAKESVQERDYGYEREADRKYDNKGNKEYDLKRKYYNDKDEYSGGDSYNRDVERENNYNKNERKNSESEREKCHRYGENENQEKDSTGWRVQDEPSERPRPCVGSPRPVRNFLESENSERKKSKEEIYENSKSYNAGREREYYRKTDSSSRDKIESDHENEKERGNFLSDYKKETENDLKRERDYDAPREKETYKDREKKSASPYEDRYVRSELKESRFHRGSRDSLRDESYIIQEGRSYSWADETEVEEKTTKIRREHYREDRGDRYSHAQRPPPGPITRAKLEAKELEADSKRNLTPLVRTGKVLEVVNPDGESIKDEDKGEKSVNKNEATDASNTVSKQENQNEIQSVWKKEDKKEKEEIKSAQVSHGTSEQMTERNEIAKEKEDKKDGSKNALKQKDSVEVGSLDKRNDRRKNNDRRNKSDLRNCDWTTYSAYHSSSYGNSRGEPKLRRSNRGTSLKSSSRRDSKYSESDYSDEISGSGRDDRSLRNEREKPRPIKASSKRYDRDDRGRDYRMDDRDYRGRNNRDAYYYKPPQRGRGGFRNPVSTNKRVDRYGPPPSLSKSQYSGQMNSHSEEKRQKSSNKEPATQTDQITTDKKSETTSNTGKTSNRSVVVDRCWKKNYENALETKQIVSSPTSAQTAEANEESFATASEGTDSEDNVQMLKNKSGFTGSSKRVSTVVVAKPPRMNFRSTSRKRYDNRRNGTMYTRKDSVTYSGTKRSVTSNTSKTSHGKKENEKVNNETVNEHSNVTKDDKLGDKSLKDYGDSQAKNSFKSRNRSNSRKNIRTNTAMPAIRGKSNLDLPPRLQSKQKSSSSKISGDYKESKSTDFSVPFFKEFGPPIPAPPPAGNAWDRPLTGTLRNGSPATQRQTTIGSSAASMSTTNTTTTVIVQEKSIVQIMEQHSESSPLSSEVSSTSTLSAEKVTTKVLENLDGASPPVQTIIFENTNFKSAPNDLTPKSKYTNQLKTHRFEKDAKLDNLDSNVTNFGSDSSNSELPNNKHDPLQMALAFNKTENVTDMNLDFTFDSEFSKLTEDSKSAKTIELTHAMHMAQASTDADLNFKIASVKKVWDGSLGEHFDDKYDNGIVNTSASFSPSFSAHGSDPSNGSCYGNSLVDNSSHVQVDDVNLGHNDVVFSPVSQIQAVNSSYGSSSNCQTVVIKNDSTSSSSNVCKVKPQPQGSSMANVAQSSVISTTLVSQPPPMSSPSYNTFSCSSQPQNINNNAVAPTALTAQINFQPYSNMPPVPSSPVLFNSSQTAAPAAGLYQAFQIDNSQVAARSPFGQYSSYGHPAAISQTSAFNQQSVFVQPPPNAPPPDLYSAQMPPYRLQAQFGNTQQITSQNTVLISSSSNSLMSATIKPSNQQLNAIGTKTGYQAAQSSAQYYIPLDPATQLLNQNLLPSGQLLSRPANNPSLQASTSFYSSASAPGQTAFFQSGTNSALQAQAGTAIGLTTFNAQSATPSLGPAGIQNFNSQLSQPYRSAPTSYLTKSGNSSSIASDFCSTKGFSPNQHDVLNPGFPPSSQMTQNKQRLQMSGKNVPAVQQAIAQHSISQNTYNYQSSSQMRNNGGANKGSQYPHPIQRPVSQGNNSNRSGNNASNTSASHRMPVRNNSHQLVNSIQQPPSSVYYSASSGYATTNASKLESSQLESKADTNAADTKLADSIKTINAKNTSSTTEKNATSNE